MVRKTQNCGEPRGGRKECLVGGEESKKEVPFHQSSKIMKRVAVKTEFRAFGEEKKDMN